MTNALSMQRLLTSKINRQFVNMLLHKYNNNSISCSSYLIERLRFNKINKIFVGKEENESHLLDHINESSKFVHDIDLVYNKYDLSALYQSQNYNIAFKNIGVFISTSESDFSDFKDILCSDNSVLSVCVYDTKNNLKRAIKLTESVHPCFKDSKTIKSAQKFPGILEYLISLTTNGIPAPVHINISQEMCKERILLQEIYRFARQSDITDIQNMSDLEFLEEIYKKADEKVEKIAPNINLLNKYPIL